MSESQSYALTPRQRLYCAARALGQNKKASAKAAGVAENSLYDWLRDPVKAHAIDAETDRLLDALVAEERREFKAAVRRARERLVECLEPGHNLGNAADTNIRAALAVLKFAGMEPATRTQAEVGGPNGGPLIVERVVFGRA